MALLFGLLALAAIPAQAATLSTTYSDDATFESTTLAAHNVFRAEYGGVTNLVWNDTLASYATTYASASCTFAHSGGPYGENIAAGYSDATATVNAWGDEGLEYDFDTPGFTETTGHFTQIVWESTLQVGCGRVTCDGTDGKFISTYIFLDFGYALMRNRYAGRICCLRVLPSRQCSRQQQSIFH